MLLLPFHDPYASDGEAGDDGVGCFIIIMMIIEMMMMIWAIIRIKNKIDKNEDIVGLSQKKALMSLGVTSTSRHKGTEAVQTLFDSDIEHLFVDCTKKYTV